MRFIVVIFNGIQSFAGEVSENELEDVLKLVELGNWQMLKCEVV